MGFKIIIFSTNQYHRTFKKPLEGSDSLYEYLYKCIKNDILLGNIRPGEKLPSKRTFAKNLGISVITVENAYAQLVAEGYLYSMPKRGFYAADLEIEDSMRDAVPKEILQVANGETSYFADFSSNQTDSEIFPFTIWTRTVRVVLNDNRIQLMKDGRKEERKRGSDADSLQVHVQNDLLLP